MDYKNAFKNQVRKSIEIPHNKLIVGNSPIILERYINPKVPMSSPFLFHSSHYRISMEPYASNITTVHDFTYEYYFKGLPKMIHCWQKYRAIRNSKLIICISENTKRDLLHFLPEMKNSDIRVVYNGVSDDYYPLSNIDGVSYEGFLLFVGGRQSYKNFRFAVECARYIRKRLLIIGGPLSDVEISYLTKELGKDCFKSIVHPSNKELNKIYNSVDCLIYPSLYEGFGIPVIEAQKAACPVIAMNSSSIPEIIGNKSTLLNSSNTSKFKEVYRNIQSNRTEIVIEGIENSKRFSWDRMTNEYLNIYNELLQ